MEYSYSETLEQQYQQYQAQQQQQQQQQQPQQHHQPPQEQQQPYDPAQAQAYEAYYAYQQQQQQPHQPHQPHQPQHYDPSASQHQYDPYHQQYHPHEYAAYQQQQQQQQPMPPAADSSTAQPVLPDAAPTYPPQHGGGLVPGLGYPQEQQGSYQGTHGLNPAAAAAVAALSQLTQFAGTMDAAERAMAGYHHERPWHLKDGGMMGGHMRGGPPPHHIPLQHGAIIMHPGDEGRSPYRGRGRRGGGPFRGGGGGRGSIGHYPSRSDGGSLQFRGRGRGGRMGRGGGKTPSRSSVAARATSSPPQHRSLLPLAWCDICRVDCNSLEILEQHKNGKRHKKTVQRFEEIQAKQKLHAESQARITTQRAEEHHTHPKLVAESQEEVNLHPERVVHEVREHKAVQEGEGNKASAASETLKDASNQMEIEQESPTASEQSEGANLEEMTVKPSTEAFTKRPRMDGHDRRYPPKRKMMRFGRGGKRLRTFEPVRSRPLERVREQPRVCTVCNVMCDTMAVFECHLAGKKHISRINRFPPGQGSVFGPVTVYIPPNQPSPYTSKGIDPVFYGLQTPEMMPQASYIPEDLVAETYGPDVQPASEPQTVKDEEQPEAEKNEGEQEGEQPQVEQPGEQPETEQGGEHTQTHQEGERPHTEPGSELEGNEVVEALASESAFTKSDEPLRMTEDAVSALEYGASSAENVIFPGLDVKVEEAGANNGELGNQDANLQ